MKTLIHSFELKKMPWKNGLGVTSEIAIDPPHADFIKGDFLWRLSSAEIQARNSFSQFPGYDRLLFVESGEGLILNGKNLIHHQSIMFHGEETIQCDLIKSSVVDIGLIFDRRRLKCEMNVLAIDKIKVFEFKTGIHFIKPLSDDLLVDDVSLNLKTILKIDGSETCTISSARHPSSFLLISIQNRETL